MKRAWIVTVVIIVVLILDQWLKFYVKTNIEYRSGFNILGLEWARIYFIENPGMAFGLEFGGVTGKFVLSIFRILMVGFLFYLISTLIKAKESKGLIVCFALIIAGALGNIIDSAFYGLIFSESPYHGGSVATFLPEGGGYAGFLQGRVVDMFYFPLIDTQFPEWFPFVGGDRFQFFRPVFNVADSAISVGVISMLLFHRSFFLKKEEIESSNAESSIKTDESMSSELQSE